MRKLEELIQELCPDGVEYKKLGDLCKTIVPPKKLEKNDYLKDGNFPIIDQGQKYIIAYTNDESVTLKSDSYIIFGDHTLEIKYFEGIFAQGADGIKILKSMPEVIPRFLYFAMCSYRIPSEGYKRHWSKMKTVLVPVPPLPVQQEIVRILDNFTELTTELTAELTARKKQYAYYHNLLMDFSNADVNYLSVGELFEIKNGLNKEKEAFGKGKPIINFTDVYNKRWLDCNSFKGLVNVSNDEIERYSAKKGDVFFTRTSETKEDIGMSSTLIEDVPNCVFSGFVLRARPTTNLLLPKFCSYYFSTQTVRNTIVRYAAFTTRATTTGSKLSKIMVPILPLEEQKRIVAILDHFDRLCNDISQGLPAEIEARQKQYEYYRDKLLTFTPKA